MIRSSPAPFGRERVTLSDDAFRRVAALVAGTCGIELPPGKEMLVRSRLSPRAAELGISTISDYLDRVDSEPQELATLIELMTTNKTSFFREMKHFEFIVDRIVPALDPTRPARIWSAGCSTGEEPYSLSICLLEALPRGAPAPVILATDISQQALEQAREATYSGESLDALDQARLTRHFRADPARPGSQRLSERVRSSVTFARLNLMRGWPMRGDFDLILCRNVMIYFSRETRSALARRLAGMIRVDGHLFIGHAESLGNCCAALELVQPAVYRRVAPDRPTDA